MIVKRMRAMTTQEVISQITAAGYQLQTSRTGDSRNMRIFVMKDKVSYGKVTVVDGEVRFVKWYGEYKIPDLGKIACEKTPEPAVEDLVEQIEHQDPSIKRIWTDIREAYRDWWAETDAEADARDEPNGVEYFNTGLLFLFLAAGVVFLIW